MFQSFISFPLMVFRMFDLGQKESFGSKYSKMDQGKFVENSL